MFKLFRSTLSGRSRRVAGRRRFRIESLEPRLPLAAGGGVQDPTNLQASNITQDSFEVAWDAPDKGADSYLVAYQSAYVPEEQCASGNIISTSNLSETISGLASGSIYQLRICSVKESDVSTGARIDVTTLDPDGGAETFGNFWQYPHRMAVSNNGHKMVIWINEQDSERHLFYTRYDGSAWSAPVDLTPAGRNIQGVWSVDWSAIDVAAGDNGHFVVGWLDESTSTGKQPRVNINRYINGSGWDHAPGDTPTNYSLTDIALHYYHGISVDMAPTGDAAVATTNHSGDSSDIALWVWYRAIDGAWAQIASNGTLTDAPGGDNDSTLGGPPAMEMDGVGNVMLAFATDDDHFSPSFDLNYAVYDKSIAGWVNGGRQAFSSGWSHLETIRVAVDKTRDLTNASTSRGLAGIVWQLQTEPYIGNVYGAMYYKGGAGGDVDADFVLDGSPGLERLNASPVELNGVDIADGQGHLLVTWTDTTANNQEMVHFWFADEDNDGLFDSAEESSETDGCQCAGWKKNEVTVNDSAILDSPYMDGDARYTEMAERNPVRVSAAGTNGLVVWSNAGEDRVHVRRIVGFDSATQTVTLEGNTSTAISSADNHTVESGTGWTFADWHASVDFNYQTGEGSVLYHSENDYSLHVKDILFGPPNDPPTADAGPAASGLEDEPLTFDASGSTDPEGDLLTYTWDFGDDETLVTTDPVVSHAYAYGGSFDVVLTASDGKGNQATDTTTASVAEVNDVPTADAGGPYSGIENTVVTFDASASTDFDNQDGTTANDQALQYTWNFGDGTIVTTMDVTIDHAYAAADTYTVTLTVSDGVASSDPDMTTAVIDAAPAGDENDMYVWDIDFDSRSRGPHTDYQIVIDVNRDSDADGAASSIDASAEGVFVTVELRDDGGNLVGTYTGTTDSNGIFRSDWIKRLSSGTYTAEVIDMAHETFDWNHLLDPTENDLDVDEDGLPDDLLVV